MKFSIFSLPDTSRVLLLSVLISSLYFMPAVAVELVGKPVPVSSSASSPAAEMTPAESVNTEEAVQAAALAAMNHQLERSFEGNHHFAPMDENALVPIMGIAFGIGGPILLIIILVAMHYRAKDRREKNINANIERLLAAGRDIPVELLRGDEPYTSDEAPLVRDDVNLHKGIKNVCLGFGLLVCLTIIFGIEFGAIGFIVLSIGISQLWLWKLSTRKKDSVKYPG